MKSRVLLGAILIVSTFFSSSISWASDTPLTLKVAGYKVDRVRALFEGRSEYGFLRVQCDTCHAEHLVAFSCAGR